MLIPAERVIALSKELRQYEELEIDIKQITGYNFETLRELFAAGWTLEPPPKKNTSFAEMVEDTPICGDCVHYRKVDNPFAEDSIIEYCDGNKYQPCAYYREACEDFRRDA